MYIGIYHRITAHEVLWWYSTTVDGVGKGEKISFKSDFKITNVFMLYMIFHSQICYFSSCINL